MARHRRRTWACARTYSLIELSVAFVQLPAGYEFRGKGLFVPTTFEGLQVYDGKGQMPMKMISLCALRVPAADNCCLARCLLL